MKLQILSTTVIVAALACPLAAQAQGIPGGIAQGVRDGNRTAGPIGAVVGGAVGGVVGGVEGVLGIRSAYNTDPQARARHYRGRIRHSYRHPRHRRTAS